MPALPPWLTLLPGDTEGDTLVLGPCPASERAELAAAGLRLVEASGSGPALREELAWFGSSAAGEGDAEPRFAIMLVPAFDPALPLIDLFDLAAHGLRPGGRLILVHRAAEAPDGAGRDAGEAAARRSLAERCGLRRSSEPPAGAPSADPGAVAEVFVRAQRPPRWRLREMTGEQRPQVFALFERAFGASMDPALWQWKYGAGRGDGVIAERGGRLVAHYGWVYRRILFFGAARPATEVCDVMVDPQERGVMTKAGAMFQTAAAFQELALCLRRSGLPFGFPSRRAQRLGEHLGLYAEVARILELRWAPIAPSAGAGDARTRLLDPGSIADQQASEALWARMARDLADEIVVIRDWAYLRYRYVEHPAHQYRLVLVMEDDSGRAPSALLVLREHAHEVELVDLVAPLARIPPAVEQARRLASAAGSKPLSCWITDHNTERFPEADREIRDPNISVPTNTWAAGADPAALQRAWWLMAGDTDFH